MATKVDAEGVTHTISWWVYAGRERIRKTSHMRGTWGHDVTCTCGWDSQTGGATRGSVERDLWQHKFEHGLLPFQQEN